LQYIGELRDNWRPLLAATIGVGSGMSLAGTITSTIAPSMIADNHWSMANFAMVGSLGIFSSIAFPFIGRLADTIGVRKTALIGQITLPLAFLAYSMMSGSLSAYITIFLFQSVICVTTTATVYSRLPVQYIKNARGLALAIVVSGPALVSAIGGPILNQYVEANGWRAAYQALAIYVAIAGTITYFLIPPDSDGMKSQPMMRGSAKKDYPMIFRSHAFWILALAMLLCNLPQTLMLTQLKLVLLKNGITGSGSAVMISALSIGMLAGRFITGLALDRFSAHIVAFITLGLPSIGLFLIASSLDTAPILTMAVFFLGFAFGSEGDIVAFLVAKHFGVRIYSSVMGLMTAIISASASVGALILSKILATTGNFDLFMNITGVTVLLGASLLLALRKASVAEAE
jgi:MFS family permease